MSNAPRFGMKRSHDASPGDLPPERPARALPTGCGALYAPRGLGGHAMNRAGTTIRSAAGGSDLFLMSASAIAPANRANRRGNSMANDEQVLTSSHVYAGLTSARQLVRAATWPAL